MYSTGDASNNAVFVCRNEKSRWQNSYRIWKAEKPHQMFQVLRERSVTLTTGNLYSVAQRDPDQAKH